MNIGYKPFNKMDDKFIFMDTVYNAVLGSLCVPTFILSTFSVSDKVGTMYELLSSDDSILTD